MPFRIVVAQVTEDALLQKCEYASALTLSQRYNDAIPVYEEIVNILKAQNSSPDKISVWIKALGTCKLYTGKTGDAEQLYLGIFS